MNDRVEWTLNFLEHYRQFPCLWKKRSPDFKNRAKRGSAEDKLLTLSGIRDVKELRAKIRSIRCTYNQEIAKIKKSKATGSDLGEVYEPKLAWFTTADSFLSQNLEENELSNIKWLANSPEGNENKKQAMVTKGPAQEDAQIQSISPVTPALKSPDFVKRQDSSSSLSSRKKSKVDVSLNESVKVIKQIAARQLSPVNEFTIFGYHVASQLQCLPLEDALILQEDIQKLITAARLHSLLTTHHHA